MKPTYLELFAGIGGLGLGFDRAGWECVAQVEKDEWCRRVLAKHWPNVPRFDDVRTFNRESISGTVDAVIGGFPCQPFSVAGKQGSTADDRHLWPEMLRVVQEFKPRWVVGENVPGIIGLFLDQAIADLETQGYEAWAVVLPAVAFDAPHRRERLFIVASDTTGDGRDRGARTDEHERQHQTVGGRQQSVGDGVNRAMAYPYSERRLQSRRGFPDERRRAGDERMEAGRGTWPPEPRVGRVANGIPRGMDRIRGLGNAVVPAVAEHIARLIRAVDSE